MQTYTRLVMVRVQVTVEYREEEGLFYASAPAAPGLNQARPSVVTVRSADKETAIAEALLAAGYGSGHDK